MRIALVGASNDNDPELFGAACAAGHHLVTHDGVLAGVSSPASLRALVRWSDLVLIRKDVENQDAALATRALARLHHRPVRVVNRLEDAQVAAYFGARLSGGERAPVAA